MTPSWLSSSKWCKGDLCIVQVRQWPYACWLLNGIIIIVVIKMMMKMISVLFKYLTHTHTHTHTSSPPPHHQNDGEDDFVLFKYGCWHKLTSHILSPYFAQAITLFFTLCLRLNRVLLLFSFDNISNGTNMQPLLFLFLSQHLSSWTSLSCFAQSIAFFFAFT